MRLTAASVDRLKERPTDRATDRSTQKATQRTIDRPTERPPDRAIAKPTRRRIDRPAGGPIDGIARPRCSPLLPVNDTRTAFPDKGHSAQSRSRLRERSASWIGKYSRRRLCIDNVTGYFYPTFRNSLRRCGRVACIPDGVFLPAVYRRQFTGTNPHERRPHDVRRSKFGISLACAQGRHGFRLPTGLSAAPRWPVQPMVGANTHPPVRPLTNLLARPFARRPACPPPAWPVAPDQGRAVKHCRLLKRPRTCSRRSNTFRRQIGKRNYRESGYLTSGGRELCGVTADPVDCCCLA